MQQTIPSSKIGIRSIAYCVGDSVPIDDLPEMQADEELLKRFKKRGFKNYARSTLTMAEQAGNSARATIENSGLSLEQIDAVVIGTSELRDWNVYPERLSKEILRMLGLNNLPVFGTTLAGCANMASSIRMAQSLLIADNFSNVLVIETNQVRGNMHRLVGTLPTQSPSTLFGDGAASCIVTNVEPEFDILGMEQIVSQFDSDNVTNQAIAAKDVASYRHVIDKTLKKAKLTPKDIDCYLANNTNVLMFMGMKDVLGFSKAKYFLDNLHCYGHIWSSDTLINLHDYCKKVSPKKGAYFLLLSQANSYYSAIICQKR